MLGKNWKRENWKTVKRSLICWLGSTTLALMSVLLISVLSGCAVNSVPAECPQTAPLPAELQKSDLPSVNAFSLKVSDWVQRVQDFVNESPSAKMQ